MIDLEKTSVEQAVFSSVQEAQKAALVLTEERSLQFIQKAAEMIADCFRQKKKVLIAGNGGSLCDAMHFAEELTGQFRKRREALAAISLSDAAHMSCVANDMGFEEIFSRSIEALGSEKDLFIALSTSGNSTNLLKALQVAKERRLHTISLLGKTGGAMKGLSDLEWVVEGFSFSDRIQEAHMAALHIIIEIVEKILFAY